MQKLILSLLAFLSLTIFCGVVFAAAPVCMDPPIMIDLDSRFDELSTKTKKRAKDCYDAYLLRTETTETEYSCPGGDFSSASSKKYSKEILSYQIAIATVFEEIDKNAIDYAHSLQCMREKDVMKWSETNRKKLYGVGGRTDGYAQLYKKVCDIPYIERLLESPGIQSSINEAILQTTDTYPQWAQCSELSTKKIIALNNLFALLGADGVGRGYQNDKDVFLDAVKGVYAKLSKKFSDYLMALDIATAKIDTYLKQTIQQ